MTSSSKRNIFRSDRYAAISLAGAAVLALVLANSIAGAGLIELFDSHFSIAALGIDLSLSHWVTDGLLVVFFFIIAVELRYELTKGELNSFQRALAPGIAAVGGVLVPALLFLLIAGPSFAVGWPIPTATDIAFALGLIALVGRGLPTRVRAFLLALAVLDDLIAIAIIALFFTQDSNIAALIASVVCLIAFWALGRMKKFTILRNVGLVVLALATWYFVLTSGVHATIAGVALGLVLRPGLARKAAHALLPFSNAIVLPLFAFSAALVVIPDVPLGELSPVFWGIAIALPVGKIIGVGLAGAAVYFFIHRHAVKKAAAAGLPKPEGGVFGWDLITVAAVAGIGFTVSLLMNELAFLGPDSVELRNEGVLGVLVGSAISIVIGGGLVMWRAKHHRDAKAAAKAESKKNGASSSA
ncbi:MAG: NhaA family Na+:H+ antiporter [Alpinimonas sp.]|jgi:NhaA family Na+:H+ antiporter